MRGQKIHSSLVLCDSHTPKARVPPGFASDSAFWDQLRNDGLTKENSWLEVDLSDYVRMLLIKMFVDEPGGESQKEAKESLTKLMAQKSKSIQISR